LAFETGSIVLELRKMKLYVGNLSFSTTEETLQAEFGAHGQVEEVAVITDRDTGRPRGFAFVTMNNDNEARAAIEALNGTEVDGRTITVNEARPKSNGGGGGGGGRGGGGYRGGGGGGRGGGGGGGGGKRW
jgi:RNA recognition motif-containing protein